MAHKTNAFTCSAPVAVSVAGNDCKVRRHASGNAGGDALHRRVPRRKRPWHHLQQAATTFAKAISSTQSKPEFGVAWPTPDDKQIKGQAELQHPD